MHNNALILARYANALNRKLENTTVLQCVSTSSNDIHFLFSNSFYLMVRFYGNHSIFLTPEKDHFPKKNVLHQFKEITNTSVNQVVNYTNDRGFYLELGHQLELHIQCFGRRSAIYLVNKGLIIDSFKDLNPPTNHSRIPSDLHFNNDPATFLSENRFLNSEIIADLDLQNFFQSQSQTKHWEEYLSSFNTRPLHINRTDNEAPVLSIVKTEKTIESYTDLISAFHDFGRLFLAYHRQASLKQQLLQETNKEISSLKKREKKLIRALNKLTKRADFKQIGDILMANLYAIEANVTEVELDNFYTGETIKIALKRDLNPQKNAERYYQKSKNAHLEVQHTEKQLAQCRERLYILEAKRTEIEQSDGHKQLQQLAKQSKKKEPSIKEIKQLPYKQFSFQGFDIWVGKNAKSNDVLLKLARKNDTWLHARGVAGSHVLIKNPEGKPISEALLEYAASLAAKFSKSQNDSLAAVIYTSPAYVRKFKGALPGQVRVDREEVILVEPHS